MAIAIFTDDPGWHGRQLQSAFADLGYDSRTVSLTECRLQIGSELPVRIPGFDSLPDGVFVRGVPGGSLEEVVFYLDILHWLKTLGVPVYNDGQAIERSVDKAMTSFLLQQAGLPTPMTWVLRDHEQAVAIAERELAEGYYVISKPLFGSQGEGIRRIEKSTDLFWLTGSGGVCYLQRFVHCQGDGYADHRVLIINGVAVAAMRRRGKFWLNNVARGARCEAIDWRGELADLAIRATLALQMDYAGVDIIEDRQGRYTVIEVNSIPAWKGLQSVCNQPIAGLLAADLVNRRIKAGSDTRFQSAISDMSQQQLANFYLEACELELQAFKPGNVSVYADGHDMSVDDFRISAKVSVQSLCNPDYSLGEKIFHAVQATRAAVACNTNLGIILLAAPLLEACKYRGSGLSLRQALQKVLAATTIADADWTFRAIALATPGGLGEAPQQDVHAPATMTLTEAMRLAADRDRIALQYVTGYRDIFDFAALSYYNVANLWTNKSWSAAAVFVDLLAAFPDSHIERKHGQRFSSDVAEKMAALKAQWAEVDHPEKLLPAFFALDKAFKSKGINPGTTADLTVATLLTVFLQDGW